MKQCSLSGCPYGEDGRCLENHLPDCPNLSELDETPDEAESQPVKSAKPATHEQFYSGEKLTPEEASIILQSGPSRIIILGGMSESGKTTLIARLFELFQISPISGYRFSGSRTLPEFDKLSWHARYDSGAISPTTARTYRSENNRFLHICVQKEDEPEIKRNIIIADIPGEMFPDAISNEMACRELLALGVADHVVLFLDANILDNDAERHDHVEKINDFLKRATQTQQIGKHTILHLLISRFDYLHDKDSEILKFISSAVEEIKTQYTSKCGGFYYWEIAARPDFPHNPTIDKIAELFAAWLTKLDTSNNSIIRSFIPLRDYCRYGQNIL